MAENQDAFVAAVNADFGCRSAFETRATELLQVMDACLHAIRHLRRWMRRHPDITNGDYTAIIDARQYERLQQLRQDALERGARLVNLCGGQPGDASRRLMPLEAVVGATDDMQLMQLMQREIFGPLLPILTYRDRQQVVDYIASRPHPLALYLYSDDRREQDFYLDQTLSGGVGLNESLVQASMHDLPFGGAGMSGMGHYHGYEGFLTFSKLRPVFRQGPWRALDLFMPPYRGMPQRILEVMTRMKS